MLKRRYRDSKVHDQYMKEVSEHKELMAAKMEASLNIEKVCSVCGTTEDLVSIVINNVPAFICKTHLDDTLAVIADLKDKITTSTPPPFEGLVK
jgi:hypothetical protein